MREMQHFFDTLFVRPLSLFHTLPLIIILFLITAFKTLTVSISPILFISCRSSHTLLAHFSHFLKHCLTNTQTLKHTPNSSPKCFSNSLQFIWFEMLLTVQHLSKLRTNVHLNKFRALRFEPGTAGFDARTLPLCRILLSSSLFSLWLKEFSENKFFV